MKPRPSSMTGNIAAVCLMGGVELSANSRFPSTVPDEKSNAPAETMTSHAGNT